MRRRTYDRDVTISAVPGQGGGWLGGVERQSRAHPWAVDILLALAVAAVIGSLTVGALQSIRLQASWLTAAVAAFAVLHLSVAARRRAPAAAYALASLAMLVVVLVPDARNTNTATVPAQVPMLFMPSSLVFLLILFTVAGQPRDRRLRALALVIAVAGAVLAAVRAGTVVQRVYPGGWLVPGYAAAALVVVVLATWSLGSLRLIRRQRGEAEQVEATRLAVLEERTRIARDMHDIVAHSLAVIVRQAEGGAFAAARAPDQAAQVLRVIADTGRAALDDMRGLVGVLRGGDGADGEAGAGGVATGPQLSLADLSALLDRVHDTGLDVECVHHGTPFPVGAATELAAYRVVQEALTNAVKYAGSHARVRVRLEWSADDLAVDVTDDGGARNGAASKSTSDVAGNRASGGAPALPVPGAGAGLQGLRERVAAAGGTFSSGRLDTGFRVRATFPRRHAGAAR